jgi:cobaltochelatase CobN
MRHGFRGAAEIANTVDNVFAYAALADVIDDHQFDLLYSATLGDETVSAFLTAANPAAANAITERFKEAIGRGLWRTRRNSAAEIMTDTRIDAA